LSIKSGQTSFSRWTRSSGGGGGASSIARALEPSFYIKSVPLTEGGLFSIDLGAPLLKHYRNTPLEDDLRRIFGKIVQSLPDNINVEANFLTLQMSFIPIAAKIDRKTFHVIFTALKTKAAIIFDYRPLSKDTYTRRTTDPCHAIAHKGNWYFIGHCHDKGEPQMFALDREWHSGQEVEEREGGRVYVKFETSQMPEVLRFVLGQGRTVKALGPPELVEQIKAEVECVRGMYE
jgi:predicted DNA-binding transcriptional regulator YafY